MDKGLKKTLFGLLVLSLLLLTLGFTLFKVFFQTYYFWFFPFLILLFLLINSAFFIFYHKSLGKSAAQFIRNFMATTGLKLVIYMVLVLVYVFSSPKSAIPFAATLSLSYIAYTVYDLYVMLTLLKRRKENSAFPNQLSN
jgi:hypothetical protein